MGGKSKNGKKGGEKKQKTAPLQTVKTSTGKVGGGRRRKSGGVTKQTSAARVIMVKKKGGVLKPVTPTTSKDPERKNPKIRKAKLDGNMAWSHDMFTVVEPSGGPRAPSHQGTKLFVSNLAWKVTTEDIKELFESVGLLVAARVHKNRSGQSAGTGEAVFRSKQHAQEAQKRYHGISLDGRPMKIELIEQQAASPARTLKSGIKISGAPGSLGGTDRGGSHAAVRGKGSIKSRVEKMQMD